MKKTIYIILLSALPSFAIRHLVIASGTGTLLEGYTNTTAWNGDTLANYLTNTANPGDEFGIIYKANDSVTFSADLNSSGRDATDSLPYIFVGLKSTITDTNWTENDKTPISERPMFKLGTRQFRVGDKSIFDRVGFVGTHASMVYPGVTSQLLNCFFNNNYGSFNYQTALYLQDGGAFVDSCEIYCPFGRHITINSVASKITNCYLGPSSYNVNSYGIGIGAVSCSVTGCVIDSVKSYGILVGTQTGCIIEKNTFSHCGYAAKITTGNARITNNAVYAADSGGFWQTNFRGSTILRANSMNDTSGSAKLYPGFANRTRTLWDNRRVIGYQQFVDTTVKDFRLKSSSPLRKKGTGRQ